MLSTRILLQHNIKTLPKKKRKDFLITCIHNSGVTKWLMLQTQDIEVDKDIFCKICNKYNFIKDNYSETCQDCGYTQNIAPTQKIYEKIEYITPGSNLVKITKGSKKITVDLNKINQWLEDTDPLAIDTKKIIDNLETIFQSKSLELPTDVKNNSISLWYNFNTLYALYTGSLKKLYNKKAILALCVYYGASMNDYVISLTQLSIIFNVDLNKIITVNELFKNLFKETEYFKYLNLQDKQECDIKLSKKNTMLLAKIKNDLNLKDNDYAGIIYYITNTLNPILKYTLENLQKTCNISTNTIRNTAKSIENFYKNNPTKYKELI